MVEPYIPSAEAIDVMDEPVAPEESPVPSVYVPSHAARPEGQRRMPRTEELPIVARRSQEPQERQDAEPRNARALFKRLASNVGLSLGQTGEGGRDEAAYSAADDAAARSAIEAGGPRASRVPAASEGARGGLDAHGRQPAPAPQKEHLEIPAFLRKHG
jgi:cell division protein FtsZ